MNLNPRVLFVCTGNACRSQMAEGWLRHLARGKVDVLSAGTRPAGVHPTTVRVMGEAGIDLSSHSSDAVDSHLTDPPDLVITVCDEAARDCPTFPAQTRILHWPFPDPAGAAESEEGLAGFVRVRDSIRDHVAAWIADGMPPLSLER